MYCSVFDDRERIRRSWVSQMEEDDMMRISHQTEKFEFLDEKVREFFKNMLTTYASDVKLGTYTVDDLLDTASRQVIQEYV